MKFEYHVKPTGERMLRVAARSIAAGWFDMVFKLHC